jgi:hypothetical protein
VAIVAAVAVAVLGGRGGHGQSTCGLDDMITKIRERRTSLDRRRVALVLVVDTVKAGPVRVECRMWW